MSTALEDVAFLTRSPNRVAVLAALASGPQRRHELVEATGASRVTVGRILRDLDTRGWVARDGPTYETTTRGRLVAESLSSLRERLDAIDRLDPVLAHFPADRLDVPLEAFADAEVTVPDATAPNRHHRRIGTVGAAAAEARMYSHGVTREATEIHRQAVCTDGQRCELLLSQQGFDDSLDDEQVRAGFRDIVAAENATVSTVDEGPPVPFLARFDGRAFVGVTDDEGVPQGAVESTDATLLAWVDATLDDLAAEATPQQPDRFTS
ncbi:IclR helix-turn-helix domain-containing protein [Halogranum gelatinilyticum]|uniref:IclR helix-turn-helix domain-containing protein n=1 Tax=Halogranum gelatinilyticum TaxID=660521 RepID=A0A1G9VNU8_9EURY|nr:helix-turn-helix domain-containing protein [Halogranum gelatinilyticum]SDM73859.1 IclR helix-turn-helix domain-containing protein [Halogranum gelatinilyticum]